MKYLLMNKSYEWVLVNRFTYKNPPDNMRNNKACIDKDGSVSIQVYDIAQCDLRELMKRLIII